MTLLIGEERHTSAGNVYRLERVDGPWRYVRRVRVEGQEGRALWDADIVYRWHAMSWEEQLPLVGAATTGYPHFGVFGRV